jgi:glycosyltransferase involved in cell wall biosynthesis
VDSGSVPVLALLPVSVVVPAYNYGHFLPQALDSILAQTHPAGEIIVVDDGSTDNTREIVAAYGARVTYIHQANAGLSATRNTGLARARHPLVVFLDADDELLPGFLGQGARWFSELTPDHGVVAFRSHHIDALGNRMPANRETGELHGNMTVEDIILRTRFAPSAVMVRREVFAVCGGFDPALRSSEDRDMWIRVAARYRVWLAPERLALIRKHSANMSSNADRMKLNMGRTLTKAWEAGWVPRRRFWFWLQVVAVYRYQTGLIYLGVGRRWAAAWDLLAAVAWWPLPFSARVLNSQVSLLRLRALARWCRGMKRRDL